MKSKRSAKLVENLCGKKNVVSATTKFSSSVFNGFSNEQKVRVLEAITAPFHSIAYWIVESSSLSASLKHFS